MCKNWADIKDKAKSLKQIIHKFDPFAASVPLVTTGSAVPGLYSHVAHSIDKDETEIPPPFKGAKPKQNRGRLTKRKTSGSKTEPTQRSGYR